MATLAQQLHEALAAWAARQTGADELASWAQGVREAWLSDPANRYAFREDAELEALGLIAGAADAPDPAQEIGDARALALGEVPWSASRTLLLDPKRVAELRAAPAAQALAALGARLERGESWTRVLGAAGPLQEAARALAGDDYVELLVLEAAAVCDDLRLAVNDTVELLGPGRARLDASLLAERLAQLAQVLRGERPMRATVRARGADRTVVLSY